MLYCTNIGEELASKITLPILEKNYHLKLLTPVGKSHTVYLHSPCESRLVKYEFAEYPLLTHALPTSRASSLSWFTPNSPLLG